jgi:hypothetical protein
VPRHPKLRTSSKRLDADHLRPPEDLPSASIFLSAPAHRLLGRRVGDDGDRLADRCPLLGRGARAAGFRCTMESSEMSASAMCLGDRGESAGRSSTFSRR